MSESTGLALTTAKYYTPSGRLIQRDYKSVSLYEYSVNRNKGANGNGEIRLTDSGRQVRGGGGVAPDVAISLPKYTPFQETLLRRDVFFPFEIGIGGFARSYLGRKPAISKDFKADDEVLNEFRRYLDKQNIRYTETDVAENVRWIQQKIRREVFLSAFGANEGYKVSLEDDIQVQKAIEVIPDAQKLHEDAKRVLAQRREGTAIPR